MNKLLRKTIALAITLALLVPATALADGDASAYKELTIRDVIVDTGDGEQLDLSGLELNFVSAMDAGLEKLVAGMTVDTPARNDSGFLLELDRERLYVQIVNNLLKLDYADLGKASESLSGQELPQGIGAALTEAMGLLFASAGNADADTTESYNGLRDWLSRFVASKLNTDESQEDILESVMTEEKAIFPVNGETYVGVKRTVAIDEETKAKLEELLFEQNRDENVANALEKIFGHLDISDNSGVPIDIVRAYDDVVRAYSGFLPAGSTIIDYEMMDGYECAAYGEVPRTEYDASAQLEVAYKYLPGDIAYELTGSSIPSKYAVDTTMAFTGTLNAEKSKPEKLDYFELEAHYYYDEDSVPDSTTSVFIDLTDESDCKLRVELRDAETSDDGDPTIGLSYNFAESRTGDSHYHFGNGELAVNTGYESYSFTFDYYSGGTDAAYTTSVSSGIEYHRDDYFGDGPVDEEYSLFDIWFDSKRSVDEIAQSETVVADFGAYIADGICDVTGTAELLTRPATDADFPGTDAAADIAAIETDEDVNAIGRGIESGLYGLLGGLMTVPGIARLLVIAGDGILAV